ncbi:hypothetical protein ACFC6L_33930 [Kitasatospora phosalacinea]|uniref:hypothetical protein n=1 Tax=Kitasatospora phosalacinea TaxID=2065 RepID=UPI0035E34C6B
MAHRARSWNLNFADAAVYRQAMERARSRCKAEPGLLCTAADTSRRTPHPDLWSLGDEGMRLLRSQRQNGGVVGGPELVEQPGPDRQRAQDMPGLQDPAKSGTGGGDAGDPVERLPEVGRA